MEVIHLGDSWQDFEGKDLQKNQERKENLCVKIIVTVLKRGNLRDTFINIILFKKI